MPIITEIGTSEFKTIHYICVDRFLHLSRFDYNFFGEANLKKNLIFYTSIEVITEDYLKLIWSWQITFWRSCSIIL